MLYKFISGRDALVSCCEGFVRFTPIPELNDPSEMFAAVTPSEVEESLKRIRLNGYSDAEIEALRRQEALMGELAPEMLAVHVPKTREAINNLVKIGFYDRIDRLKPMLDHTVKLMQERTGIFCLSRRFDSFPMWAHYGANGKGFVIEYDDLDLEFRGDSTGVLDTPRDVDYLEVRPSVTFDPNSHIPLFFSKLADWSYEREVRIVKPLTQCTNRRNGKFTIHLFKIDPQHVKRVIVGWNVTDAELEKAKEEIGNRCSNVQIVRARLLDGSIFA